jgi:hypothetical protein
MDSFMLIITAYLDESGTSHDTDFVSMAGLVAAQEAWETFEYQWREALERFEIPYFHMKEYAPSVGCCAKWKGDEEKRREVLSTLIRIIDDAYAMPFGAVVSMADYRRLSQEERDSLLDPYYICLQDCAMFATMMANGLPPDERVAIIFSQNKQFESRSGELWRLMKEKFDFGFRLSTYAFSDMKDVVQLQAADIVAYEMRGYFDRLLKRPQDTEPRWGMQRLVDISVKVRGEVWMNYYNANELQRLGREVEEAIRDEREQRGL